MKHLLAALLCLLGGLAITACGSSRHGRQDVNGNALIIGPEAASSDAVDVALYEYRIDADPNTRRAGRIDLVITNAGAEEHELVIVPVDGERYGAPFAHTDHMKPGESTAIRIDLDPGEYSLACLVVSLEEERPQSHMALGMQTRFEVTR